MLTAAANDMLTRTGPGTPMGNLMREYWIPACLSSELKADGEPMRLMLLGEQLIAFRDTDGRVGIMEHRCPHRCASLFFGRNEEGGLRCVYHGWKFDVEGNCLDMPNVPPAQDFKHRIKAKAYKVVERAGFVWTYMGQPPGSAAAAQHRSADAARGRAHHARAPCASATGSSRSRATSTPRISASCMSAALTMDDVSPTPSTTGAWAIGRPTTSRPRPSGARCTRPIGRPSRASYYYRFAHFMFPFITLTPNGFFEDQVACTLNVPMDDTHTMTYNVAWKKKTRAAGDAEERRLDPRPEARGRIPAEHQRLVRPLAPGGAARERLPDRPRHAEERQLHRHPGHRPAGPGDDRMHGRGRRSLARASGAVATA